MNGPVLNPVGYPPDTVLNKEQCAAALGISVDTLERSRVPVSYALGERSPRYLWRLVCEYIAKGAVAA